MIHILWSLPCVYIKERIHIYFWIIAHARFNANNIFVCVKKMEFDTQEWLTFRRRNFLLNFSTHCI